MILHTHTIPDEESGENIDVYVLHTNQDEARQLHFALSNVLVTASDSEAYTITLGRVDALAEPEPVPIVTYTIGTDDEHE